MRPFTIMACAAVLAAAVVCVTQAAPNKPADPPVFCDTMVALADAYDKRSLAAAFVDGVFLLAVPVPGDLFEPGSIRRSVYDCEDDIHEFLKELTIAHRVIDYLHANRPERPA